MVELTRRDALAALAAAGVGSQAGCLDAPTAGREGRTPAVLVAAAEVLYPGAVSGHREFVETYVLGRIADRPSYWEGVRAATRVLDDRTRAWYDGPFRSLSTEERDAALRQTGADVAEADPRGSTAQRIRYYVVEELLYALYTSPVGGRLAGIENPVGYPGGTASYQRGPEP